MAAESPSSAAVGRTLPWTAALALLVMVTAAGAAFLAWRAARPADPSRLTIASGSVDGAYHSVALRLAELLEEAGIADDVEVRPSEGSGQNMQWLADGEVDLALLQSDTPPVAEATLLASLYPEVLQILVAAEVAEAIAGIVDLAGRRVSIGAPGSGTHGVARLVLRHFRVEPAELFELESAAALERLGSGGLDAVFLLTALPGPVIEQVSDLDAVRFLSLGDAQERGNQGEALALVFPRLEPTVIPRSTYGRLPREPVSSVAVTAQLVAHRDLPSETTRRLLEVLYDNRVRFDDPERELNLGDRLRERYHPLDTLLPYHPGAVSYYERSRPPFLVEYAEAISLGLTLLVGLWSGSIALRQWVARRRKNRIDAYYLEVVENAPDLVDADRETLVARRAMLLRTRDRAFADLVAERLDADESFSIFQEHVASELASIERWLASEAR